jgi:hypothetical protein
LHCNDTFNDEANMLRNTIAMIFIFFIGSLAHADCKSCMEECPHNSRDLKACDSGCPGICDKKKCTSCLAACPHDSKDLKACDLGCPQFCSTKPGTCIALGKTSGDSACYSFKSEEECSSGKKGTFCDWQPPAERKKGPSSLGGAR